MGWLTRFLGGCVFAAIMLPTAAYGIISQCPHSSTCPCDPCGRANEKADREMAALRAQYPHLCPPGSVLMTREEWREKELDEEPLPWEKKRRS